MASSQKLSIRLVFADSTKSTVTINDINPEVGVNPQLKQIIGQFNDERGGSLTEKIKNASGANCVQIDKASLVDTDREYIF